MLHRRDVVQGGMRGWAPGSTTAEDFHVGANLPWVTYGCDFGRSPRHPGGGLAQRADLPDVRARLVGARQVGVEVVRWFLFCDGRAGVSFDSRGWPRDVHDEVWRDIDVALRLAADAGLGVVFAVFDFHWWRAAAGERRLGPARAASLADPFGREALVGRVLAPVARRFGGEPTIRAWDLVNEPEWVTLGLGAWNPLRAFDAGDVRAFLRVAVEVVHAETRHACTVGSASLRWLPLVQGLGLDVYQAHWYDRLDARAPLGVPIHVASCDAPVVLGEFPTRGSRRTTAAILDAARTAGYSGAWLWSLNATDSTTDAEAGLRGVAEWRTATGAEGPRGRGA
jgi:hypothetical protein